MKTRNLFAITLLAILAACAPTAAPPAEQTETGLATDAPIVAPLNTVVATAGPPIPTEISSVPAVYIPSRSETPVTPLWDPEGVTCSGEASNGWASPGIYHYRDSAGKVLMSREPLACPENELVLDPGMQLNGTSSTPISRTISIRGLGALDTRGRAVVRTASGLTPRLDHDEKTARTVALYACGYGLVRCTIESSSMRNRMLSSEYEYQLALVSFTPTSTKESHVRYILADLALANTSAYYHAHIENEETAEALRRWDAGVRVVNTGEIERRNVDGQWLIVVAETGKPVRGMDVILTSDSP